MTSRTLNRPPLRPLLALRKPVGVRRQEIPRILNRYTQEGIFQKPLKTFIWPRYFKHCGYLFTLGLGTGPTEDTDGQE